MSDKRRDHKGRILKEGEGQLKNSLRYTYRYRDPAGKRATVYADTLAELREREKEIQKILLSGQSYLKGRITVTEMVKKYISTKKGVADNTKWVYEYSLQTVQKYPIGKMMIADVRRSDVKQWFQKLQEDGLSYCTILAIRGVVKPAFQMAYEDEIITRNPASFAVTSVIENDTQTRDALTEDQENRYMDFVANSKYYSKYYDMFIVLFGTGMRIGELCGLTMNDLDFQNRKINIDHQLIMYRDRTLHVKPPKTAAGVRQIPMSDTVYAALIRHLNWRAKHIKTEYMVDSYIGFVFCQDNGRPRSALNMGKVISRIGKKYKEANPTESMPKVTAHVFRHTFCTNMALSGMNPKNLQYIMGHSDVSITLNIYTHTKYENAKADMLRAIENAGLVTV